VFKSESVAQAVKHSPSKHKALSSNPNTTKKIKIKEKWFNLNNGQENANSET
jgi:hypothetical protein